MSIFYFFVDTQILCVLLFFLSSPLTSASSAVGSAGDFAHLLEENQFVDKTMFLKSVQNGDTSYITAPRRFGKTTVLDMVHRFYQIPLAANGSRIPYEESEDYIRFHKKYLNPEKNLAITRDKVFFETNFGTRPVLRLDFKGLKTDTVAEYVQTAAVMVALACKSVGFLTNSNKLTKEEKRQLMGVQDGNNYKKTLDILLNLDDVIHALYVHFDNTKILILIDELDSPVQKMLSAPIGPEQETIIKSFQYITGKILKDNPFVWRGICVGVVTLLGILSYEANNVQHKEFQANIDIALHFGSTTKEITFLKEQYRNGKIASVETAKKYYGGYRVQASDRSKAVELFNTFSVKHYFEVGFPGRGWTAVVRPPFISELLRIKGVMDSVKESILGYNIGIYPQGGLEFSDFKLLRNTIDVAGAQKDIDVELPGSDMVMQYFFELGYYTTVDSPATVGYLKLRVPNQEIKQHLINIFVDWFAGYFNIYPDARNFYRQNMTEIGGIEQDLKNISICVANLFQYSVHLPKNLNQFTSACLSFLWSGEDKQTTGEFDTVHLPGQNQLDPSRFIFLRRNTVTGKCTTIVFSFSFNSDSFTALKQIARKEYKYTALHDHPPEYCKGKHDLLLTGLNYSPGEISSSILYNNIQIEHVKHYAARIEIISRDKANENDTRTTDNYALKAWKWFWSG